MLGAVVGSDVVMPRTVDRVGTNFERRWLSSDVSVTRLNHAVLYVRDAQRTAAFFADLLDFVPTSESPGGVFMQCSSESKNDHDLAFFTIGEDAAASPAGRGAVGTYHLGWEVPTLGELVVYRDRLREVGSLVGSSSHGVSRSLYCQDPDGLEFELMWAVPIERLDDQLDRPGISPLNLERDIVRFGADLPGRITA